MKPDTPFPPEKPTIPEYNKNSAKDIAILVYAAIKRRKPESPCFSTHQ
jgi:hypothetical protein